LTFVENGRARMVQAILLGIGEFFTASFVNTLGRHAVRSVSAIDEVGTNIQEDQEDQSPSRGLGIKTCKYAIE
jgi:hypothetical protein